MKHKTLLTALLLASSFLLSGCLTLNLWDGNPKRFGEVIESQREYQSIGEDTLVGFAQVQSSQQIAMIGEKYVYLFTKSNSEGLLYLINNLHPSNPFTAKEPLEIVFEKEKEKDGLRFYTRNTRNQLIYHPATLQEKKAIEKMRLDSSNYSVEITPLDNGNYAFNIRLFDGNVYATGENINIAKTSKVSIPISLYSDEIHSKLNGKSLIKKIVVTPFALAGDIIFLPLELILPRPRFR